MFPIQSLLFLVVITPTWIFSDSGPLQTCAALVFYPGSNQKEICGSGRLWDLNFTLSGRVLQRLPQGDDWEGPHDLVLLKPGAVHAWSVPDDATEPWVVLSFIFEASPDWMPLLDLPETYPHYCRLSPATSRYARRIRRALLQAHDFAHHPAWQALAMNAIERALLWVKLELSSREYSSDQRVQTAMELMSRRIMGPPSVPEVAAACGISVPHLSRLFLEHTGQTLRDWQEQARMAHAQNLLAHTQLSVKQVADTCGYGNQRHFATRFRKLFGLTPLEHRQRDIAIRKT